MSRPAHQPTDQLRRAVAEMAAIGLQKQQVARILGIDMKTLAKYYRKDFEHGLARVVSEIGRGLIAKARDGDRRAQEFFLRSKAGWRPDNPMVVNAVASATVKPVLVVPGMVEDAETWNQRAADHQAQIMRVVDSASGPRLVAGEDAEQRLAEAERKFEGWKELHDMRPWRRTRRLREMERAKEFAENPEGPLDA
jgi:hypothetical protein